MSATPHDILNHKFDTRFDRFDADGDGYLVKDDILAAAHAFLEAFGEPPDSPKGRDIIAAYGSLWNTLLRDADSNHDGRISREEFKSFLTAPAFQTGHGYQETFGPIAEAVHTIVDANGDGTLR